MTVLTHTFKKQLKNPNGIWNKEGKERKEWDIGLKSEPKNTFSEVLFVT